MKLDLDKIGAKWLRVVTPYIILNSYIEKQDEAFAFSCLIVVIQKYITISP